WSSGSARRRCAAAAVDCAIVRANHAAQEVLRMNAPIVPAQIAPQPQPSPAVAALLQRAPRLFIGGEWVEARSAARVPVMDPATGRPIASVADAGAEDVDRAVAAARRAFESGPWPDMLPRDREALIWKLADLVEGH